MALDRYCTSIDVSLQTLSASLYPDENLLQAQDGVGLYDGSLTPPHGNARSKEKSPNHFAGRLHLTSHRLLFVASLKPHRYSLALDLAHVRQTEYYAGFLKSSPKITLLLGAPDAASTSINGTTAATTAAGSLSSGSASSQSTALTSSASTSAPSPLPAGSIASPAPTSSSASGRRTWICRVCGMSNISSIKCSLCGITRDKLTTSSSQSASLTAAASAPSPSSSFPTSPAPSSLALRSVASRTDYSRSSTPPPLPPLPASLLGPTSQQMPDAENSVPEPAALTLVDGKLPCPVCTFLNHHSMSRCELCDSPLPSLRPAPTLSAPRRGSLSTSRPSTPDSLASSNDHFMRLSFRTGGEREFYNALKEALARKAWDWQSANALLRPSKSSNGSSEARAPGAINERAGGIDAIMKSFTLEAADRDQSLESALKDLQSLMSKAKDMIQLAQSINKRLVLANAGSTSIAGTSTPTVSTSEKTAASSLATSSLASLGLIELAITPDLISESQRYHEELAKELGTLLNRSDAVVRRRGVVGLDEAWCAWNRARGVALISPKDFRLATPYLPMHTSPMLQLLTLPSGLTILHTSRYSLPVFSQRIWDLLDLEQAIFLSSRQSPDEPLRMQGLSTIEIAQSDDESHGGGGEGIGIGLVKELLEMVETRGEICRDQGGAGGGESEVRWFRNYFESAGRDWDGTKF
ncbi:BZ3500_MvSof-1268-A1-R1_Chr12-2g03746 [Microbotryum saponariae]|uniref:Vacuolar protein-sorting-associated protein 36 n=1 Tax=Microbotryum saponariae TaxID=289078 RepID=A0A2X0MP74_9BASI|nr:BZ3500_MvSof-1268-A1-R1_Chr12-2g03746 [Microbotryum saponariae]SDA05374.1 BZ3501_MvSof-1269-A2-R1_Chr12-1g03358 [Microbotryum saponariae]